MIKLFALLVSLILSHATLAQDDAPEANQDNSESATDADPPIGSPVVIKGVESLTDQQVPDREKAWLAVAGSPSLAFYLSEITGRAYGGVLLLPKLNHHPASLGSTNTMRHALAANHWHTLALNPEDADEARTMAMIAAGIIYLNQQGVYNIAILGEGLGAAQALRYVASLKPKDPSQGEFNVVRALVMINADNKIAGSENNTLDNLSSIKMPILDAFSNNDFRQQRQADERKRAAHRPVNRFYQQVRIPLSADRQDNKDNPITKRIRGWLDKNAAGFMVDR